MIIPRYTLWRILLPVDPSLVARTILADQINIEFGD